MNYETLKNILFKFDPETAHELASIGIRAVGCAPFIRQKIKENFSYTDERLSQNLLGMHFANPIGLGGGFDKNATMINGLGAFGFGFVEVGTITPVPQLGNKKPRLFRLIEERSLQNAMGFNNDGVEKIRRRLKSTFPNELPIIANIGKNKVTANEYALKDYEFLVKRLTDFCNAFTINISSPNTPNLRDLQSEKFVKELVKTLKNYTDKPLILKIAPDMEASAAVSLCQSAANAGISAIIINNTSIDYTLSANAKTFGGISGALIKEKSRALFEVVAKELFGKVTLISCGGIDSAEEALERIKMGASLVEIYTAFIYEGPSLCKNLNLALSRLLDQGGFASITDAIGANLRK